MTLPTPTPVLAAGTLYLAHDQIVCDRTVCAGGTALYTGRTRHGAPVRELKPADLAREIESFIATGIEEPLTCECGALSATITDGVATVVSTPRNVTPAQTAPPATDTGTVSVTGLTLDDAAQDLRLILDGSGVDVDVDGITVSARSHPAHDPDCADEGYSALLVTFTDRTGRNRIADVEVHVRGWREDDCWHLDTRNGAHGTECAECGTPVDTPPSDTPA